jgi:uncharacterized protein YbjT (DUF2867 family)
MRNILVFGATGPQANPVAHKLVEAGYTVTAFVRDPAKAQDLAQVGIKLAIGDLDDQTSVERAMAGQDGVFLLVSFLTGNAEQALRAIEAARVADVQKIVWNATGEILPVTIGNPPIDMRRNILAALEQSGISFVALQPTVYTENFLLPFVAAEIAQHNTLAYPMPDQVQCQWISHQDAASFAVAGFGTLGENLSLRICGPDKVTGPQIAEGFSRALGRTIKFRAMPPREFAEKFASLGNSNAEAVAGYYESVFNNPELMNTDVDYQSALARLPIKPTTIEDFARRHRSVLGW